MKYSMLKEIFMISKAYTLIIVCLFFVIILPACGGGSSGNEKSDSSVPSANLYPKNGATEVPIDSVLNASFSKDILTASLTKAEFKVKKGDDLVDGVLSFDELTNVATFKPNKNLARISGYELELSSSITDLSGNAFPLLTSSFVTADGVWRGESLVENQTNDAFSPALAVSDNGDVVVAWIQDDGSHNNVWANTYKAETATWGQELLIDSEDLGDAQNVKVAVDAGGNALVIWKQFGASYLNLWVSAYTKSSNSWTDATLLEGVNVDVSHTALEMDAEGNAMVVWAVGHEAYASQYINGTWINAVVIDNDNHMVAEPDIGMDEQGKVFVTWQQYHNPAPYRHNIWVNIYEQDSGWVGAELLETDDVYDGTKPEIGVDDEGNAIVVWLHRSAADINVYARRYSNDAKIWSTTQLLASEAIGTYSSISELNLESSPNGAVIAIWKQRSDSSSVPANVMAKRFTSSTGWQETLVIDASDVNISGPKISVDDYGNGLAVWSQPNEDFLVEIWSRRYVADGNFWLQPKKIETQASAILTIGDLGLDMNSGGEAMAVWSLYNDNTDSDSHIWHNIFN